MGLNFDLRVSIHPNLGNIFMANFTFGLAYSPLNSAKLSCSSEVTLSNTFRFSYRALAVILRCITKVEEWKKVYF